MAFAPKLAVQKPVPEDIDIAQSVEPVHISEIATELGLQGSEYDLYGIHKAKVRSVCSSLVQCYSCRLAEKTLRLILPRMDGSATSMQARDAWHGGRR
jgi:hypothetical protein